MKMIDFPIERINEFLKNHIFVVETSPYGDENTQKTNVKVKLTGVKDYYSTGDKHPHIEYTMFILPTSESSDVINSLWASIYGSDTPISTTDNIYYHYVHPMSSLLMNFLKVFSIESRVICTRVVNEAKSDKFNHLLPT